MFSFCLILFEFLAIVLLSEIEKPISIRLVVAKIIFAKAIIPYASKPNWLIIRGVKMIERITAEDLPKRFARIFLIKAYWIIHNILKAFHVAYLDVA